MAAIDEILRHQKAFNKAMSGGAGVVTGTDTSARANNVARGVPVSPALQPDGAGKQIRATQQSIAPDAAAHLLSKRADFVDDLRYARESLRSDITETDETSTLDDGVFRPQGPQRVADSGSSNSLSGLGEWNDPSSAGVTASGEVRPKTGNFALPEAKVTDKDDTEEVVRSLLSKLGGRVNNWGATGEAPERTTPVSSLQGMMPANYDPEDPLWKNRPGFGEEQTEPAPFQSSYNSLQKQELMDQQQVNDWYETVEGAAEEEARQQEDREFLEWAKQKNAQDRASYFVSTDTEAEIDQIPVDLLEASLFTSSELRELHANGVDPEIIASFNKDYWGEIPAGERAQIYDQLMGNVPEALGGGKTDGIAENQGIYVTRSDGSSYPLMPRHIANEQAGNTLFDRLGAFISRPWHAIWGSLDEFNKALLVDNESTGGAVLAGLSGAGSALWGTNKTSSGNFIENMGDYAEINERQGNAPSWYSEVNNQLEKTPGGWLISPYLYADRMNSLEESGYEWLSDLGNIAYGFAGEFVDPLNLVGGKVFTASRGLQAADKASDVSRAARSVVDDVADVSRTTNIETAQRWVNNVSRARDSGGIPVRPSKLPKKEPPKRTGARLESVDDIVSSVLNVTDDTLRKQPIYTKKLVGKQDPTTGNFISYSIIGAARDMAEQVVRDATFVVGGGTRKGTVIGLNDVGRYNIRAMADRLSMVVKDGLEHEYGRIFKPLREGKINIGDPDQYQAFLAKHVDDPFVKVFAREYDAHIAAIGDEVFTGTTDTIAKLQTQAFNDSWRKAVAEVIDSGFAKRAQDDFFKAMSEDIYSMPAIRIGSKDVQITWLGKAYQKASQSLGGARFGDLTPRALSHEKQFPGQFGRQVANVRRMGKYDVEKLVRGFDPTDPSRTVNRAGELFENHSRGLKNMARQYTKEERRQISDALDLGIKPTDPHLLEGYSYIKNVYSQLAKRERDMGLRSASDVADNYQYVWVRALQSPKSQKMLRTFRGLRKEEGSKGWLKTTKNSAKDMGLRVIEDPFQNLMYRVLKSERDLGRSYLLQDIVDTYGVKVSGGRSDSWALNNNLVKIKQGETLANLPGNRYTVSKYLQDSLKKGEQWYIPENIANLYTDYYKLSSLNMSEELSSFVRATDSLMNTFKVSATLGYPGFHLKNMVGDIFMGILDGVKVEDYSRVLRTSRRAQKGEVANYGVGRYGEQISHNRAQDLFDRYVQSGGFTGQEIGPTTRFSGSSLKERILGAPRATGQKARDLSEAREDFGRFVHFIRALDDEIASQKLRKINSPEKLGDLEKAASNAAWRVDKYKFDYGALTKTEKGVLRRFIPFYTYSRKALPIALSSLYYNPALAGRAQRFYENSSDKILPDWIHEPGFRELPGGGAEPFIAQNNVLPYAQLGEWTGNADPTDMGDLLSGIVEGAAGRSGPLPNSFLEYMGNKDTFTGAPITPNRDPDEKASLGDAVRNSILDHLPPVRDTAKTFGPRENEAFESIFGRSGQLWDDPVGETLTNRMFLGGPVTNFRATNDSQHNTLQSQMWEDKRAIQEFGNQLTPLGLNMGLSESREQGASVIFTDIGSGDTVFRGNLADALSFLYSNFPNAPKFPGLEHYRD